MKKKKVRQIIEKIAPDLYEKLALRGWQIGYEVRQSENEGECERNIHYRTAIVRLNHKRHDNEKEIYDTLKHELLHLIIAEFDLYRQFADLKYDSREETIWHYCIERVISNLEQIL